MTVSICCHLEKCYAYIYIYIYNSLSSDIWHSILLREKKRAANDKKNTVFEPECIFYRYLKLAYSSLSRWLNIITHTHTHKYIIDI